MSDSQNTENKEFPALNEVMYRLNGTLMLFVNGKKDEQPQLMQVKSSLDELTKAVHHLAQQQERLAKLQYKQLKDNGQS